MEGLALFGFVFYGKVEGVVRPDSLEGLALPVDHHHHRCWGPSVVVYEDVPFSVGSHRTRGRESSEPR